ncbi:unnamed protein product [marine sediment metagenome]|uniref:Uncharacterized protein n=1 Tax=marine sediment metagenome TaxID=412755 RepID=X1C6N5_9ZZZZ
MNEFKASIIVDDETFENWEQEQIREYLTEMLSRMAYDSSKNGYPLDIGLLEDEDYKEMREEVKQVVKRFCRCDDCFLDGFCPKFGYNLTKEEIEVFYRLRGIQVPKVSCEMKK